jgi:hypothetical protein
VVVASSRLPSQQRFSAPLPNIELAGGNCIVLPEGELKYEDMRQDRGRRWDALLSFLPDIGSSLVRADHLMERYVVWCDRWYTRPPLMTEKQIAENAMDVLKLLAHRANEESVSEMLMCQAATLWYWAVLNNNIIALAPANLASALMTIGSGLPDTPKVFHARKEESGHNTVRCGAGVACRARCIDNCV